MKIAKSSLAVLLAVISLATGACGSDATTSTSTSTVTEAEQVEQSVSFLSTSVSNMTSSLSSFGVDTSISSRFTVLTTDLSCTSGSGSFSLDTDATPQSFSMTYDNCVIAGSTFDGGFMAEFTDSGSGSFSFTLTYDDFSLETSDGTTMSSSGSFSATGTTSTNSLEISYNELSGTFVIDGTTITAVFDGDLALDTSTEILTGLITITTSLDATGFTDTTITCDFTGGVDINDTTAIEASCVVS